MNCKSNEASLFLPQEIIEEILPRLPAKSLLRYRCVSKPWRSLIGSKGFIKNHLQISSKNKAFYRHILDDNWPKPFYILGCCNGLVCILKRYNCNRILWNPATRIYKELPEIDDDMRPFGDFEIRWKYGFGWDESSCAYKVLVVWHNITEWRGKVYSSKTNSWKRVKDSWLYKSSNFYGKGQFASGKLHWLRRKKEYIGVNDIPAVLTFDFKTDEFGTMKLPCPHYSVECLGVLGESLCVVSINAGVWVMKEDECWVKVMDLLVYDRPYKSRLIAAPLCIGRDFEIALVRGSTFLVYNPQEDMISRLKEIRLSLTANVYVESLVSPIINNKDV